MQKKEKRNFEQIAIPPLHPQSNPVETFMKPLGKVMKIAAHNKQSEQGALSQLLNDYRSTPHPATGVPPSQMMFRDPPSGSFPSKELNDETIQRAVSRDKELKKARKEKINSSKYKKHEKTRKGDRVLLRNYKRTSKFQPLFLPDPFTVTSVDGAKITGERDGKVLKRHLDDVKTIPVNIQKTSTSPNTEISKSQDSVGSWQRAFKNLSAKTSLYLVWYPSLILEVRPSPKLFRMRQSPQVGNCFEVCLIRSSIFIK